MQTAHVPSHCSHGMPGRQRGQMAQPQRLWWRGEVVKWWSGEVVGTKIHDYRWRIYYTHTQLKQSKVYTNMKWEGRMVDNNCLLTHKWKIKMTRHAAAYLMNINKNKLLSSYLRISVSPYRNLKYIAIILDSHTCRGDTDASPDGIQCPQWHNMLTWKRMGIE